MVKIFKYTAFSEGVSFLLLLFNMLIVKHLSFALYKTLVFPIGITHGILFVIYVVFSILIKQNQNWSLKEWIIVNLASFIPFGTFYIEKKYLKNV